VIKAHGSSNGKVVPSANFAGREAVSSDVTHLLGAEIAQVTCRNNRQMA
jgi:hypothetical protein